MSKPVNTVDLYFKSREVPYEPGTRLGDTVQLYPDTYVPGDLIGCQFAASALGVTPIRVTLTREADSPEGVPEGAFFMRLPTGACLYGTEWVSGETAAC